MPVITILCHGTSNSTNRSTSGGSELVISKIATLLHGSDGTDWILNEGAGTAELARQPNTPGEKGTVMGILAGQGVEANVERSLGFIVRNYDPNTLFTVNLAGHSRGSITCYKIAYRLFQSYGRRIPVNIFAIDPVPGNNGRINEDMYKQMALRDNVTKSFLMLAESEHRQNFRPYVDERYAKESNGEHKFDTMPGTHGGINELTGSESEAAALVLSRALRFLKKNGSLFNDEQGRFILDDAGTLRKYSKLMMRISEYKAHASVNPFKSGGLGNLALSSFNVEKHRIVNVAGPKQLFGAPPSKFPNPHQPAPAGVRGRADHHGLGLNQALKTMGVPNPHAQRAVRFFANKEHERLFGKLYPILIQPIRNLEQSGSQQNVQALRDAIANTASLNGMNGATLDYFLAYCEQTNVLPARQ